MHERTPFLSMPRWADRHEKTPETPPRTFKKKQLHLLVMAIPTIQTTMKDNSTNRWRERNFITEGTKNIFLVDMRFSAQLTLNLFCETIGYNLFLWGTRTNAGQSPRDQMVKLTHNNTDNTIPDTTSTRPTRLLVRLELAALPPARLASAYGFGHFRPFEMASSNTTFELLHKPNHCFKNRLSFGFKICIHVGL